MVQTMHNGDRAVAESPRSALGLRRCRPVVEHMLIGLTTSQRRCLERVMIHTGIDAYRGWKPGPRAIPRAIGVSVTRSCYVGYVASVHMKIAFMSCTMEPDGHLVKQL